MKQLKLLRINAELLIDMFKQNGSKRIRFEGMPEDAISAGIGVDFEQDDIMIQVESKTFPSVECGSQLPKLEITVHEMPPCQHLSSPSVN